MGNEANRGLVDAFAEMSTYEFKNKDTFKALAYKKVRILLFGKTPCKTTRHTPCTTFLQ